MKYHKAVAIVISSIVALIAVFYLFNNFIYQQKQGDGVAIEPYRATLSGEYVCLPYEDTRDSETEECLYGLKTDTGEFYGVDFFLMSQTHESLVLGQQFSANGVVQPKERLSAAYWHEHPIEGIFSVTDSLVVIQEESLNTVSVSLGDVATVMDVTISPQEIVSDSRCPVGVQCVWEGTVEVKTTLSTDVAHGAHVLTLGASQVFGEYMVTLIAVSPVKNEESIADSQYELTYEVR